MKAYRITISEQAWGTPNRVMITNPPELLPAGDYIAIPVAQFQGLVDAMVGLSTLFVKLGVHEP